MLIDIGILLVGLLVLSWSADRFVYGASAIALILGITALFKPMLVASSTLKREMSILVALVFDFNFRGQRIINRWQGGVLLALCVPYQIILIGW